MAGLFPRRENDLGGVTINPDDDGNDARAGVPRGFAIVVDWGGNE